MLSVNHKYMWQTKVVTYQGVTDEGHWFKTIGGFNYYLSDDQLKEVTEIDYLAGHMEEFST